MSHGVERQTHSLRLTLKMETVNGEGYLWRRTDDRTSLEERKDKDRETEGREMVW